MSEKIKVGISIGDVNGIGLEVIIKSLIDPRIFEFFTPIVYGSSKVASFHRKALNITDFSFNIITQAEQANPKRANLINCWSEDVVIKLGEQNEIGGKYAFLSLERATEDLLNGKIDVLVTAPINKHNIQQPGFNFPGHTEYLQSKDSNNTSLMMMVHENLRIGMVTGHVPIQEVSSKISEEAILEKVRLLHQSLKSDFWIQKPKIAILGLNPHAGDNGLIGEEEIKIIQPAIEKAQQEDILCFGPYPADAFFAGDNYHNFDGILAMYHDQGLIPFKHIAKRKGINFTAGLNFIRTSPDHGTGYDIAGKGLASEASFLEAIFLAKEIYKKREETKILTKNPLVIRKLSRDRE